MKAGWVFRRPPNRPTRRVVVHGRRAGGFIAPIRRQLRALRRVRIFRRQAPVLGRASVSAAPHLKRKLIQQRHRIRLAGRRIVVGTRFQAGGQVVVRLRKPARRVIRRIQRARVTVPTRTQENFAGPVVRMLKAVARARRAFQQRLRWKPRPIEPILPPVFEQVHATERGTIMEGGAVEGYIQEGGGVRGTIQ